VNQSRFILIFQLHIHRILKYKSQIPNIKQTPMTEIQNPKPENDLEELKVIFSPILIKST